MHENETSRIPDMLGEPPDISAVKPDSMEDIFGAAFELYKDAASVALVVAHLYGDDCPNGVLPRDRAILVGLLIRITKFMAAVMQLSDGEQDKGEVVLALNRSIMESVVNLKFLITKDEPRFFSQFVEFSLGPERELHDVVEHNRNERGHTLPIEQRMLSSIDRIFRLSGIPVNQARARYGDWGGGLKQRLKAIDLEEAYVGFQRIPSHCVHGSWVDLLLHFLEEADDGFTPRSRPTKADPRIWLPPALLVLDCVEQYARKYFPEFEELPFILDRITAVRERIGEIDQLHENWMSSAMAD